MNLLNELDLVYERIREIEKDKREKEMQAVNKRIALALGASVTALAVSLATFYKK